MTREFLLFLVVAFVTRLVVVVFCTTSGVGLMPDEAQYWTWSQHLDIGYYSKPPAIAWQIALGTFLFGSTEFGVRFLAMMLPVFTSLGIYGLVREITSDERASWCAAIAFLLSPMGMSASILATTDSGMVLCWVWALLFYVRHINDRSRFLYLGAMIALGALWKWFMYSLWVPIILFELSYKKKDFLFLTVGFAISCLGLLPSYIWNLSHNFVTFRHVGGTLLNTHSTASHGNVGSFVLAGVALISPGFFILGLYSCCNKESLQKKVLQFVMACIWGGLTFASCFRKVQGNWAIAGQVLIFVFIGLFIAKHLGKKSIYWSCCLVSVLVQAVVLATPYVGWNSWSPFAQGIGTDKIAVTLLEAGYNPKKDYLISDRYQTVSDLSFYGPDQKHACFLNIHGLRQNQFCFWPGLEDGGSGYFATIVQRSERTHLKNHMKSLQKKLIPFFDHVGVPRIYWLTPWKAEACSGLIIIQVKGYHQDALDIKKIF